MNSGNDVSLMAAFPRDSVHKFLAIDLQPITLVWKRHSTHIVYWYWLDSFYIYIYLTKFHILHRNLLTLDTMRYSDHWIEQVHLAYGHFWSNQFIAIRVYWLYIYACVYVTHRIFQFSIYWFIKWRENMEAFGVCFVMRSWTK